MPKGKKTGLDRMVEMKGNKRNAINRKCCTHLEADPFKVSQCSHLFQIVFYVVAVAILIKYTSAAVVINVSNENIRLIRIYLLFSLTESKASHS